MAKNFAQTRTEDDQLTECGSQIRILTPPKDQIAPSRSGSPSQGSQTPKGLPQRRIVDSIPLPSSSELPPFYHPPFPTMGPSTPDSYPFTPVAEDSAMAEALISHGLDHAVFPSDKIPRINFTFQDESPPSINHPGLTSASAMSAVAAPFIPHPQSIRHVTFPQRTSIQSAQHQHTTSDSFCPHEPRMAITQDVPPRPSSVAANPQQSMTLRQRFQQAKRASNNFYLLQQYHDPTIYNTNSFEHTGLLQPYLAPPGYSSEITNAQPPVRPASYQNNHRQSYQGHQLATPYFHHSRPVYSTIDINFVKPDQSQSAARNIFSSPPYDHHHILYPQASHRQAYDRHPDATVPRPTAHCDSRASLRYSREHPRYDSRPESNPYVELRLATPHHVSSRKRTPPAHSRHTKRSTSKYIASAPDRVPVDNYCYPEPPMTDNGASSIR